MADNVSILSGLAGLQKLEPLFRWSFSSSQDREIYFTEAYKIRSASNDGLHECVYSVMYRKFQDLSFTEGKRIKFLKAIQDNKCDLREYTDGKKFVFFYELLPVFDSFDREWGDRKYTSVYVDNNGVNLIHSYCGYRVGNIEIYLGLKKSITALDKFLTNLYQKSP